MSDVRPEIAKMAGYVPGEQPQAGKFIKLNTNENPYPPSERVGQALLAAATDLTRYPDPMSDAFRIRAGQLWGVGKDWILCGNGSDDILTILTRTFVGAGDTLRLPYPSYILYRTLAEIQGAHFEEIHFQGDWSLAEDFCRPSPRLKLAFLPNPNSPSGTLLSPEQIKQLADSMPCPLIVDEAYADFAETNCVELVKQCENVMVSRTLSKAYGLAGLRFGYLIAQPKWIEQLTKVKDSYNCDTLSIAAATAAIDDQAWLVENRARVLATRARLELALQTLGFAVTPSQANFVWCTRSDRPLQPLYEGLKARQILVRYMRYPSWGEGLRISIGTDSQIDACLATLESLLADK
ncbi:MAG: histidinol-phosphate transaminase [Planctomycetales bacterium]|nr:histidinol-phosphate transaminase [Planctomycetales bacterium]